jgi:hypothetical protein
MTADNDTITAPGSANRPEERIEEQMWTCPLLLVRREK